MNLRTGTLPGTLWPACLVLGVFAATAHAAVPATMNYQGYLTDSEGGPRSGTFPMTFAIYADSLGGPALWSEARAEVPVSGGLFSVLLGAGTALPQGAFSGATLWLETAVSDPVLTPRRPLVAVPYSFRALVADSAARAPAEAGDSLWTASGGDVYRLGATSVSGLWPRRRNWTWRERSGSRASGSRPARRAAYVLTSDGSGLGTWAAPVGQGAIGGGGTASNVARFTATQRHRQLPDLGQRLGIGIGTQSPSALLHLRGNTPSSQALIVQGADGQGANLQEWRSSAGAVTASVSSNGVIFSNSFNGNSFNADIFNGNSFAGSGAGLYNLNASNITSGTLPAAVLYGSYWNQVSFSASGNSFSCTFTAAASGSPVSTPAA